MKIRNYFLLFAVSFGITITTSCGDSAEKTSSSQNPAYETIENDPTNTRIYTLDNGLKVYLSVNEEAPRVQTSIAVRAGSKNDPATATGLAHYLEHMLFKGTDQYGTSNFSQEGPLLDQIDSLYEVYRNTRDEEARTVLYAQIDSISQVASTFAIANEYDKMVSEMGAKGTNAYTSFEQTVYINDIPTNQIEKWLTLEAERFRNPQLRLFHTELEAVYEEKNRSLDSDFSKTFTALFDGLYPNHQYGQQTTIGTIDHLKNPSLTEIKKYFNTYYVPNNMAICMSGDFDPDMVFEQIKAKFGGMESKVVPTFEVIKESPLNTVVVKEEKGPDAEFLYMGYRFDGVGSKASELIQLCDMILANRTAGLIDLNLNQQQKVLNASSFTYILSDYSSHILNGSPKQGQTLEEVKDLLLSQMDSLKAGAFPDWLLEACINDLKISRIRQLDENWGRTSMMVDAFIQKRDWKEQVNDIEVLKKYTKEDVVNFAKTNYNDNYVVVYKRTGKDESTQEVVKPKITPVQVNRDDASPFLKDISAMKFDDIQPRFLDYDQDINQAKLDNGIKVRSVKNSNNDLFNLYYVFDMGKNNNIKIDLALDYLPFLGTSKYSPSEIQQEFYKIGCNFQASASDEKVYVSLSGLTENFEAGVQLFEHLLADAKPEEAPLKNLVNDILKERADDKLSKGTILFGGLSAYAQYGSNSPFTNILSEKELNALTSSELTDMIHSLNSYEHRVLYYGPMEQDELIASLKKNHNTPQTLKPIPASKDFVEIDNEKTKVFVVDYDMKQAEIMMLSKKELYNPKTVAAAAIYNEYFGGGMGSIVFQEMRESKALAYSVYSVYRSPGDSAKAHYVMAYIGAQADKLKEAMAGMTDLLNNMPESEKSFELAKKAALEKIRTERITKFSKLWNFETAQKRGLDYDIRKDVYEAVPNMTMADLKAFHEQYIKDSKYNIMVIGKKSGLDIKELEKYGPVTYLTLEQVFGY
ncbi:M16 family metallopeptidase [Acidiluteibacter ferrifornacis]|uniref:Insulinase family protein n=1 Tax=Acidiluteibacter ferrifornacis TaxID=2692424 RepID=A0A6N9NMX4_9FLAO|nr:insulinase family protein [Acidiluteibacter ferrifornacis]NBG67209.1 insulinase family protein [Acidiluteibacter ferrifornacis]